MIYRYSKLNLFLSCLLFAFLTGCETPIHQPEKLRPSTGLKSFQKQWELSLPGGNEDQILRPFVDGQDIYAATHAGVLARYQEKKRLWQNSLDDKIISDVGVGENLVVVATRSGRIEVFDASNGEHQWKTEPAYEVVAAPLISGGLVVIKTANSRVIAFEADSGKEDWSFIPQGLPALKLRKDSSVVKTDDDRLLMSGLPGGKVVLLDHLTGRLLWAGELAIPSGSTEIERIVDVASSPLLVGKNLCAISFQGQVGCFDFQSPNPIWQKTASSGTGLLFSGNSLFYSEQNGDVVARAASDGQEIWRQESLSWRKLSRPIRIKNWIVVSDGYGFMHGFDVSSGRIVARSLIGENVGNRLDTEPLSYQQGILIQSQPGQFTFFNAP